MTARDKTTAVLSIWPVHVDSILDGSKVIEFRRQRVERFGWAAGPQGWRYAPADWQTKVEVAW